jgi:hypothetical protein
MRQPKSKPRKGQARNRRSPWPILLLLGGMLLVAAVIVGSLLNSEPASPDAAGPGAPALTIADIQSSPQAQIDGLKVDFGDMKLGAEVATLRLTLRNTGSKTLKFSQSPYIQLADGC